jgi:hypothetical protein
MLYGLTASSSLVVEDDEVLYPVPQPIDNSPKRSPSFWPVSSYAESSRPMKPVRAPSRHVNFANSPTHSVHRSEYGVKPYSEVYGMHPRDFDFDEFGNKMRREPRSLEQAFFPREASYSHEKAEMSGRSEFFPSESPYLHHRESGHSRFPARGSYSNMSDYRGGPSRRSDDDLYSAPMEWGKW